MIESFYMIPTYGTQYPGYGSSLGGSGSIKKKSGPSRKYVEMDYSTSWEYKIKSFDLGGFALPESVAPRNTVQLVIISDTHTKHKFFMDEIMKKDLKKTDNILIHLGDWSNEGDEKHTKEFMHFLKQNHYHFKYILIVGGNHERVCGDKIDHDTMRIHFDNLNQEIGGPKKIHYFIYDTIIFPEYGKLTFTGISWWEKYEISSKFMDFKAIPEPMLFDGRPYQGNYNIHFLLSHHPPYEILDDWNNKKTGSKRITDFLQLAQPNFHLFGHAHKVGKTLDEISGVQNNINFINVAQSVAYLKVVY